MRFYRFNLDTNSEYESLRLGVDGVLGYSAPSTCITPYATAPVDQKGRVVLNLVDSTPGYDLLAAGAEALVSYGKAKSLTQDEYDASFFPAPTGSGGVSSWNDLTDKPASFTPSAHASSHATGSTDPITPASIGAQKTITVSSAAPTGGTSGDLYVQTSAAGQVTPATLTADANDYAPSAGDIYRISSNAARNITGWTAWTDGTVKLLVNVGGFAITLKHQSTSSSASNRFITPTAGDYVLPAGGSALIYWDATDSRVRAL